jgi:Xaa-Pro aminopeptidase
VVAVAKTIKNSVEMQGIRESHERDGVALTAFLSWLDTYMASTAGDGACCLSEHEAAVKLETFRAAMPLYVSPSFDTISSYGSNGAIIHYHPPSEGSACLGHSSLYLLDSGGQYLDGTTDVTRTLYYGPCEFDEGTADGAVAAAKFREMRDAFTYVLKAHIALATAKFPEDTMGYRLVCV